MNQQAQPNQPAQSAGGGGGGSRRNKRRRQQVRPRSGDLWRPVPQLPDPEPIAAATDPGILLRSLGSPPLQGQGSQAEHAFELVVRRSALLASALAAAAGLLAEPDSD
ncbi:MAG: hypothetical protein IPG97_02910 [Microthrixaceae bacterium]|nr:hypothetical protein [Microthrixaceae bacterium]